MMLRTIRAVALAITCACVVSKCAAEDDVGRDQLLGVWEMVGFGQIDSETKHYRRDDSGGWEATGLIGPQYLRITDESFVHCGRRPAKGWKEMDWKYDIERFDDLWRVTLKFPERDIPAEVRLSGNQLKVTCDVPSLPGTSSVCTYLRSSEEELQKAKKNPPVVSEPNPTSVKRKPTDSEDASSDPSNSLTAERQIAEEPDGESEASTSLTGVWEITVLRTSGAPERRIAPNDWDDFGESWKSAGLSGPQFFRITDDTFTYCGYTVHGEWTERQWGYGFDYPNPELAEFRYPDGVVEAVIQLNGDELEVTTPVPSLPTFWFSYACRRSSEADLEKAKKNRPDADEANSTSPKRKPTASHAAGNDHSNLEKATLTAERQVAEEASGIADAAVEFAAAKYQAEAGKSKPDPEQLTLLEVALQSQVRQALKAKMKVRELRLQLAALDLQEVQAEHERRKSMLDVIVAERVQSVIAKHDLANEQSDRIRADASPGFIVGQVKMPNEQLETTSDSQIRTGLAATRYIFPGELLSEEDFHPQEVSANTPVPPDPITSFRQVHGRYLRWPLQRGAVLGRSHTTSTSRSPETIANEVLENIANDDVFGKSKLRFIRTAPNCFDPGYSLDNWAELPAWTPIFINTANSDLINAIHGRGGTSLRHAIAILNQFDLLQLVWTDSDGWEFHATGNSLSELVKLKTSSPHPTSDFMLQALILRQIARTLGKLPESVFTTEPQDTATVERLKLRDRMLAANADGTWIGQEQLRLSGLLELVPAQTIRRIIQQDDAGSGSTIRQWIYALSTQAAFRTGPDMLPPPIDPVLLLTILESLTGQNEVHDERISYLCESDAFHRGQLFPHHIEEILTGTLVYRETVLQSLANMYDSAKSEKLRQAIAKLAPGVVHRQVEDANESADKPVDELLDARFSPGGTAQD